VLTGAQQMYAQVDKIHAQADELHHSLEDVHQAVHQSHEAHIRGGEPALLVTDDGERPQPRPFPIVGVGASAGGYEAFTELLSQLPRDLGMAIVLVQHLDPKHKSKLTELLGHSSKLPVIEATNGLEVQADNIYVIPENTTMAISDGRLRLFPRETAQGPPMPIDAFFRSLAEQQQNRAIAVILSGTGTDGSMGIEAVKGEGGITFAQDKDSAKYFGMPESAIGSGAVDFTLPPRAIAKELIRIARHPFIGGVAKPIESKATIDRQEADKLARERPGEMSTLFNLLRQRKGVDFSLYKQSTLKRRIIRRMILHKIETLAAYVGLLQKSPGEVSGLFNDLLIGVTNFFRDADTFEVLKKKVFPRILKLHHKDSPLRFWVCGCATGEEAYSLAIALTEFFEENRAHRPTQIFATDISESSIEKARAGVYRENILQDVTPERLRRFFTKSNGHYQAQKAIRELCVFARQNMLTDPPFSNLDLITCRNVLIYFGPTLQRRIIPMFHYALRPEGFLLLGRAETIGSATDHFALVDKKHKIYGKKIGYARPGFEIFKSRDTEEGQAAASVNKAGRREKPVDFQDQVDKVLLRDFSPATVVTNAEFDVMHFRGRTGNYLEHAPGTASLNLLKMVRESLVMPLRVLLNRALKQNAPVSQSGVELRHNGQTRHIVIDVRPFRMGDTERFFMVIFRELEPAPPLKGEGRGRGKHRREIARLETELKANKESLQSIIEEQEATNEELKSANEEIQSSNEELQSTNEELETAKEELQSTNEELTTLNEELQNRNTELSDANNDLANLLVSVSVPILMVGTDLAIRRMTPVAERLFNVIPADIGRRLSTINHAIMMPGLEQSVARVIEELITVEREVQDRDGHWWVLRIRPYRTQENKIEGAVILLVDIDELRRALEVTLGMVTQPLVILDGELKVHNANRAFLETFQLSQKDLEGKSLFEAGDGHLAVPNLRLLLEDILPKNKRVIDYELEGDFGKLGRRKFKLNASRLSEEGRGMQLILLAAEDVTPKV
jgi:two-component system CheB/CheR fusion protein